MKNTRYYIQPINEDDKLTVCEIIRNILWYIAQIASGILAFAMVYIIIIIAYVFS